MDDKLLVLVEYQLKPGCRDAFLKEMADNEIVAKCSQEPGCGKYELFVPVRIEDSVLLIEKWRSREDQANHKTFDTYSILTALKDKYVLETIVDMYDL